ncbi:hypothetical protein BOTCAL_0016g00470 [Botryotinia calthae]|uniref:Uncharacterized protein n=1 Tax=Botryotinia calthae TaxID=38488 RepID=A0A4Y8DFT2_9HELO|nr:hypothetical protein BOTCAL_0016g00470 [Botryotinia calthae]
MSVQYNQVNDDNSITNYEDDELVGHEKTVKSVCLMSLNSEANSATPIKPRAEDIELLCHSKMCLSQLMLLRTTVRMARRSACTGELQPWTKIHHTPILQSPEFVPC